MRRVLMLGLLLLVSVFSVAAQDRIQRNSGKVQVNSDGSVTATAKSGQGITLDSPVTATQFNTCQDAGANDTYTCSLAPAIASYTTGQVVWFKANTANSGAATLNLNSIGAKTIKKNKDSDLADNDIKAGQWVAAIYDGTNFELISPISNAGGGGSFLEQSQNLGDVTNAATARSNIGAAAASHTHALAEITDEGALAAKNTVGTSDIDAAAVTYSKIQNVSATDRLLGRATAGAGVVEEIPLTAAGRALIDDANAPAQRTTLGLGTSATLNVAASGNASSSEVVKGNDTRLPVYKIYRALLTQSGTDAPVATVLENSLGGTVVWNYSSAGTYTATLSGGFTVNKTGLAPVGNLNVSFLTANADFRRTDANTLTLITSSLDGFSATPADDMLTGVLVQVYVYP